MDDTEFRSLSAVIYQKFPDAKVDQIGETFGKTLQSQAVLALVFSFIGMAIVIFLAFRTFVPAVAVVLSAFADMVMTAATMNIVGIPLSLGTLAALLMLIGYSVDSDILLTNRVLKRQGKLNEKLDWRVPYRHHHDFNHSCCCFGNVCHRLVRICSDPDGDICRTPDRACF